MNIFASTVDEPVDESVDELREILLSVLRPKISHGSWLNKPLLVELIDDSTKVLTKSFSKR